MTGPFYYIHVTTAFVNPFTSDVIVETTGQKMFQTFFCISSIPGGQIYLRRLTEVSAHQPAASNKYQFSYGSQQSNQTQTNPNEQHKRDLKLDIRQVALLVCHRSIYTFGEPQAINTIEVMVPHKPLNNNPAQ